MRKERRNHKRLNINFKSKLKFHGDLALNGVTRNISFGGAFIELEAVPQVCKNDYFSLVLLGKIEFTCRVIHSNQDGIGFKFDFILIKYYEYFKNLMLTNAPDPNRLIKELERWGGR
jgi:hypothetical protein